MTESRRALGLHLGLVLLALCVVGGPFVFGLGVDVPDDLLYTTVPNWEWLRTAIRGGLNPYWMEGRLAGAPLHAETTQMGPLYPTFLLVLLLPLPIALPLTFLLHGFLMAWAVRWLARGFGASGATATLAGIAYLLGPVGLAAFIEAQADALPILVAFPLILGCHHRAERSTGPERARWVALGAMALGAMLLGAHLRHAAGACGALGVWFLLRWRSLPLALGMTVLGLLAGAVGVLPAVLEWRAAQGDEQVAALAIPPLQTLHWTALSALLAPKPFVTAREFGLGAVLGLGWALGLWAWRTPAGRADPHASSARSLAVFFVVLMLAAADLPVIRWLLVPLTLLAHPTLILYAAVAMVPAAVLGARGLDRWMEAGRGRDVLGAPELAVLTLAVTTLLLRLTPLGFSSFGSPGEWWAFLPGVPLALLMAGGALMVGRRGSLPRRRTLVLLLGVVELGALAVRMHTAVPSRPLRLADRAEVEGAERLAAGSLHVGELAVLVEDGLESALPAQGAWVRGGLDLDAVVMGGELEDVIGEAPELQARLLVRRWPVQLAAGRGWRSLSGRVKLAPPRSAALVLPLARELAGARDPFVAVGGGFTDAHDVAALQERAAQSFVAGGLGARTAVLFGIPRVVDEAGGEWEVPDVVPACFSPARVAVEPDEGRRVRRLLEGGEDPRELAVLESAGAPALTAARVRCDPAGRRAEVEATGPALVVFREVPHPGWSARDEATGRRLELLPVNQVHQGVWVESGSQVIALRFVPPGLRLGGLLAAPTWLVLGLGLARWRRRGRTR